MVPNEGDRHKIKAERLRFDLPCGPKGVNFFFFSKAASKWQFHLAYHEPEDIVSSSSTNLPVHTNYIMEWDDFP